jgi:hypothetical protein
MRVLETGFGNSKEAFLEKRILPGVNIIFSNDNNKGKTLVVQGLMYSLGNEPIFPSGFDHHNYMFYSKIEIDGKEWSFLRKCSSIIALSNGRLVTFDSISEFKHFFHSNIHQLPIIRKDDSKRIADFSLVYQLFYLPQDKRNTSTVIGSGYLKKADFYELIYSLAGSEPDPLDNEQIEGIKKAIALLEEERKNTNKRFKFAKSHPNISEIVNKSSDKELVKAKRNTLENINTRISEMRKDRYREINRKTKLERLIFELNSLNRELTAGRIICADCGSKRVVFENNEFTFDVSNQLVRKEIIESIQEQIKLKEEVIEELTRNTNHEQDLLKKELESIPKSVQTILLYSEEILSCAEIDDKLLEIDGEIKELKQNLENSRKIAADTKSANKNIISDILIYMNKVYKDLDPEGSLLFDDLFTKSGETYSGSEEQEFYFAKIIALSMVLNLKYPIIIDSFRDGELSSGKELFMLKAYINLGKQVILSSTLKREEYSVSRYNNLPEVNAIDYSSNTTSHILSNVSVDEFVNILKRFNIVTEVESNRG